MWQPLHRKTSRIHMTMTSLSGSHAYYLFFPSLSVSERKAWKWTTALCWRKQNAVLGTAAGDANNALLFSDPNHMEMHTFWILFAGGTWIWGVLLNVWYYDDCTLCLVEDVFRLQLTKWKPSRWWMIRTSLSCQRVWGRITVRDNDAYASVETVNYVLKIWKINIQKK